MSEAARGKGGAGQPRSLEKSPPKKSFRGDSPLKEFSIEEFSIEEFSIEEFSIEEFSTQAVPLQRGRFALPPPQDFFCLRLFLPGTFCFRTRRATGTGEMGHQVVSERGCEQEL
ncbi:hypothetical protein GGQ02_002939 [Salinibacter ruber]|uniref:hypothetical protein n=1 Tax=Salinibacter ruber TaxID=146919 RepID=UPI000E57ED7D|nr:hypothetical protein [Salinibacter ruber]MCS4034532.1 hypothetical protein [Salinibacter ruber]